METKPNPQQDQPAQPSQDTAPKQFDSADLSSTFTPLTAKNALNPMAGNFNPAKLTPDQVAAVNSEWHSSKIVKFGFGFLYLVWAAFIAGTYGVVGFVSLIMVTVGIVASYKIYRKTKSHMAWIILIIFLVIAIAFMTLSSRVHG